MKIKHYIVLGFLILISTGCLSVERYNAHLERDLTVEQQLKDIEFVHRKLKKNHPKLDWYVSQEMIDFRFDSLKATIKQTLKPNEFFLKLQPVVSEIRHGHTDVMPLFPRYPKHELKRIKDSSGPLSQLTTFWQNDSLYLVQTKTKDSLVKPGAVILSIDSIAPTYYLNKFHHTFYGDGFNTSYFQNRLNRTFFTYYYNLEHPIKDSVLFELSYQGKKYPYWAKRTFKKGEENKKIADKKDTIRVQMPKKVATVNPLKSYEFSFNKSNKTYARVLSFPTNDSTFAMLRVSTFSYGDYTKDYQKIFELIKTHKVKNLVLDLRNNGGGRLADAFQLFSYFVPNQDEFLAKQSIVKPSAFQHAIVSLFPKWSRPIVYPISLLSHLITRKDDTGYYIKPQLSRIRNNPPDHPYTGNLYVIINGGSFSASSLISSNLKGFNRAYFVGEETGGDANGSVAGLMPKYELPHSKLKLHIGTVFLEPKYYQTEVKGHGIFPNKEIKTTLEDRIKNSDPQLRWIITDVKQNNKALRQIIPHTTP